MAVATSSDAHFKSFERIHQYPIVNDSFYLANTYYQWIKSKNSLLDSTLQKAEHTLKTIKDTAEPIAAKKLAFFDNVVYNQLDRVEKRFPIVLEPSSTITNIPASVYRQNIQPPLQTLMWPVSKTIDVVSKTSNFAVGTIKSVLPIPDISRKTTNYFLDKTEELLDNYLPDEDNDKCNEKPRDINIYSKVKRISAKTRRRVYRKTINQIEALLKSNSALLKQIDRVLEDIQEKRKEVQTSLLERYSITVESIRDNIPDILSQNSDFLKETFQYVKDLPNFVKASTSANIEYVLESALEGLSILNGGLYKLQTYLNDWKPELISDNILKKSNDVVNEVRIGLDSFIQNMREVLKRQFHDEEKSDSIEMNEFDTRPSEAASSSSSSSSSSTEDANSEFD